MEKLGLETTSSTPSCLAICLIREVFPAPIRPLKTQIACPEQKAITSLAASGSCSWCMRVIFFTINAWYQMNNRYNHFFQGHSPMLKSILIVIHIIVVVVGIGKEIVFYRKDIAGGNIYFRQFCFIRLVDFKYFSRFKIQVFPLLIP